MAENNGIQKQVKKIPAFTVLKNNSVLKNIFLLRKPPPFNASSTLQDPDEEILLVGRHPHCNITLEHPSISRYHLRIHSNPASQVLSVVDLSSVHGTWVSGKRIEPEVPVNLKEGDTVKIGGSSRIYELHWVPLTQAFDVNDPFMPALYTVKEEGEETNKDEKRDALSSDDDLECVSLLSSDEIHSSPLNKSNSFLSPMRNLLNSSCDDTEVELSSPSKTNNENGEILSTFLCQPPLVSGTVSVIQDSDTLSKSKKQSISSRENTSNEFKVQNHGIIKDDPFSVPNCSKSSSDDTWLEHSSPSKTGHENAEFSIITEAISESEDPSNWWWDNMSDELVSVPNCSNSSCDDTEVEHSNPLRTGHEKGEISSTTEAISQLDDLSNWHGDNDEAEPQNHGIIKDDLFSVPNCSNSSCDDTEVYHSSPLKTGHEKDEIFTTTEVISESEDLSNWRRDEMSAEFEPQNHGIIKDDLFSVPNCSNSSSDDTEVEHSGPLKPGLEIGENSTTTEAIPESEDPSNWCWDNISNEFEELCLGTTKNDLVSVPNCSNSSCDDTKVEHLSPLKTGHEKGEISTTAEAISESEDLSNWRRDEISDEFKPQIDGIIKDDLFSVPNFSFDSCDDTEAEHSSALKKLLEVCENSTSTEAISDSEDPSNWLRDNENEAFEQLGHVTAEDDLVSVALLDAIDTHEKDAVCQDIARGSEIEMCIGNEPVNQQKTDNVSVPFALFNGVNRDEDRSFMEDIAGDSKVDNDHDIAEKESVFVALLDGTDMDQEQDFTPDVSRAEEVHMNLKAMKNTSVSTSPLNGSCENDLEIFTPDKENKNPNACMANPLKKRWMEDEHKQSNNHHTMSKKTLGHASSNEKSNFGFSKNLLKSLDESNGAFTADEEIDSLLQRSLNMLDDIYPFDYNKKVLFSSSEQETKSRPMKMEGSCTSINYPQTIQKPIDSSQNSKGGTKKQWIMVVDTNSLLSNESLKHLKLLQGLKGTQLFIPKLVIRELMNIKCQNDLLAKSMEKASFALKWIDECMVNTKWWIRTDDDILHSSEAAPNVLKTALHLRKEITDRNIIVLSNDLTLKIEAMAEGVMCETTDEFHRSLVNPFSERFMWVGSSARGPTWSCVDDDFLRRKYHGCGSNVSHGLEGLRLLARITTFR